jgi:alkylation response protein AidB-like acyl-CoA dehydrogenase
VRAWLDANATRKSDDKASFRARNDDPELLKKAKEWQAKKAAAGYARMTWPKEFGGRGASPILQVIYQQEEANYLVPLGFFDIGLGMCIPTMMAYARRSISSATSSPRCMARRSGASSSPSRPPAPTSPASAPAPSATETVG